MSQFVLPVADDVPGKSTSKDPRQSRLIVRTTLSPKVKASLKFVVNGRRIEPTVRRGGVYLFDQPPVGKGPCRLEIGFDPPVNRTVRIEEIEFLLQRDLPDLKS